MSPAIKTLIIECGVAETRAALLIDSAVHRFWFGAARGDETMDDAPRPGRLFAGRVRSIDKALKAAFVDIGVARDAFLPIRKSYAAHVTQGTMILVRIKSPPRQAKGAALRFVDLANNPVIETPGRLGLAEDPCLEALHAIGDGARHIVVDDGEATSALIASDVDGEVRHEDRPISLFEAHGADAALELAFERCVPLDGGGALYIDEAQALTAIDVDSGARGASSSVALREKLSVAAADEALRQISLRDIGGHVVIDFPTLETAASRTRFGGHLRTGLKSLEGAGALGFSKSGLCSFTVPHRAQSLAERFTEAAPSDPTPGRRFTLQWTALSMVRRMEKRLRAAPRVRLSVRLAPTLDDFFQAHGLWRDRLSARYGARFDWTRADALEGRAYDLAEQ